MLRRLGWLLAFVLLIAAAAYAWAAWYPLRLPQSTYAFDVRPGATLRSVARELTSAGVIPADWIMVALARATSIDRNIKAGNYEIGSGTTLLGLLAKLTQGDVTQSAFTIVEGWTFRDVREALKAIGNEGIEAPVRSLELDPEARAVQIRVLTLIEVKRQVIRAALGAAIGRALEAKEVADRRAVDRQRVDEWIALRASGAAGERSYHRDQEACGVDWTHRRHGVPLYFYARLS